MSSHGKNTKKQKKLDISGYIIFAFIHRNQKTGF